MSRGSHSSEMYMCTCVSTYLADSLGHSCILLLGWQSILTPEILVIGPAHPATSVLLKFTCRRHVYTDIIRQITKQITRLLRMPFNQYLLVEA